MVEPGGSLQFHKTHLNQLCVTINVHLVQNWLPWWCRGFCKPEIETRDCKKIISLNETFGRSWWRKEDLWRMVEEKHELSKFQTRARSSGPAWSVVFKYSWKKILKQYIKEILESKGRTSKREPWLAQKYFVTVFLPSNPCLPLELDNKIFDTFRQTWPWTLPQSHEQEQNQDSHVMAVWVKLFETLLRCLNYSHFQTILKHGHEHGHNHLTKSKTKIPSLTCFCNVWTIHTSKSVCVGQPTWTTASFLCCELCRKTCSHASLCKGDLVHSVSDSSLSHCFAFCMAKSVHIIPDY